MCMLIGAESRLIVWIIFGAFSLKHFREVIDYLLGCFGIRVA